MSSSLHLSHIRNWFLQFPLVEYGINMLRDLLIGALRQGPIPKHIAFVMDGNRRFARSHKIETVEGHNLGFGALGRILEVCYKSGVKVVTVYAFSIENFKRPKYEVDALMDMARVRLSQLSQHGELLDRYGAKIRVLGQRDLLRPDVLEAIDKAVELTAHNDAAVLNICFPYTSREEMTTAIRDTVVSYSIPNRPSMKRPFSETHITRNIRARNLGTVTEESSSDENPRASNNASGERGEDTASVTSTTSKTLDVSAPSVTGPTTNVVSEPSFPDVEAITAATLTSHMFTADNPPLDLLVRTSGVERLSDFMLWQAHQSTQIAFLDCMWPEFDLWQFFPVLLEWQWRQRKIGEIERGRNRTKED